MDRTNVKLNVFAGFLKDAIELSGANEGGILSVNHEKSELRLEEYVGLEINNSKRIFSSEPSLSISGYALHHLKLVNIADTRQDQRFHSMSKSNILSTLTIPIVYDDVCICILNLESIEKGFFTSRIESLLINFTNANSPDLYISILNIENDYLLDKNKAFEEVMDLMAKGSADVDQDELFLLILNNSLRLTKADVGGILLLTDDRKYLKLVAGQGLKESNRDYSILRGEGICWKVVDDKKLLNIWNVDELTDTYKGISSGTIRSELAVPLILNDKVIGVINVESRDFNAFGFEQENVLKMFAMQVSIIIHFLLSKRRWEGAWSIARWGDLSNNLSHKMNNQVGAILHLSKRLIRKVDDSNILKSLKQIEDYSDKALDILEKDKVKFNWSMEITNIEKAIEVALQEVNIPEKILIKLNIDNSIELTLPRVQFVEMIRELVSNSIKYMGEVGTIEISASKEWDTLFIEVVDSGDGFSVENVQELLELGKRGSSGLVGTGYGLWWIKQFIHALGGAISLSNATKAGAKVSITVPVES